MRKFICLLATVGYILMASSGAAKVYWLPDFLGDNTNRSNGLEDNPKDGVVNNERGCPNGWLDTAQKGDMTCDLMGNYPWVGYCYSNCKCKLDKYPYTSNNCSGTKAPSGDECNDGTVHYKECIDACDTVEGVTNCPYGCKTTFEAEGCPTECKECYTNNCHNRTSVEDSCSYGCESYFSDCSSKCQKCYADNCRNRVDNSTDLGCDTYWSDCSTKCEVGKTCVPTDCSAYTLTSCPANATCTNCTVGCGNTTKKYKISKCNTGYTLSSNSCVASSCASGYAIAATNCGSSFSNGSWTLGTSYNGYSGSSKCYKCTRTCNSGYELSGTTCAPTKTCVVLCSGNNDLMIGSDTVGAIIDWGDGSTSTVTSAVSSPDKASISHNYTRIGCYEVSLKGGLMMINAGSGNNVIANYHTTVENVCDFNKMTLTITGTNYIGFEGSGLLIDWGDGSFIFDDGPIDHTYAVEKEYTIKVYGNLEGIFGGDEDTVIEYN